MSEERFWAGTTLGELSDAERGEFYDHLRKGSTDDEDHFLGLGTEAEKWESPGFRVGRLEPDGRVVPADTDAEPSRVVSECDVDVILERYFAASFPSRAFKLQVLVAARHRFDGQGSDYVGHGFMADGVVQDYAAFSSVPVLQRVHVETDLTLNVGVMMVTDKAAEKVTAVLGSPLLHDGIELTASYNRVFGAALTYMKGLAASLLAARQGQMINDFHLGLSSTATGTAPRLVEASYVLIQIPRDELKKDLFSFKGMNYSPQDTRLLQHGEPIAYNHVILRVRRSLAKTKAKR